MCAVDKGGNARQRAIRAGKAKQEGPQTNATVNPVVAPPTPSKHWSRKFAGPIFVAVSNFVVTIFMARGYLDWIPDWALALSWFACLVYWLWAVGVARSLYTAHRKLSTIAVLLLAIFAALVVKYRMPLWGLVHPSKDAPYVAPTGHSAVLVEGNVNPTHLHCYQLPEDKQIACLCPRPLDYALGAMPTPPDNNYATLVDIKAKNDLMYRIQLFARSPIHPGGKLEAIPHGAGEAAIGVETWQIDLNTLGVRSSAPEEEFKVEVRSSEGLRLKCINQIN